MLIKIKKILVLFFALSFAVLPAYAQLVPDGTTNTNIASAEFDTPVINIAAPNEKGLSHNKFTDYNVTADNLVINNNKEQNKISKIGGYVEENPNLVRAGKEASIILNEVTGTNKTNLNGYTEMLGKNADLVIANPNGINIAGAGFINIPKVTLVTGSSNINAEGELESFNLSNTGIIDISKDSKDLGLSAENSSLYLSGRYVKIGGNVYADLINILTGSKNFNYLTKEADSYTPSSAPAATEYAVDTSSVGGMYAGSITIIGTEEGFGVKNNATLVTDIGDVTIKNEGGVEVDNINSGNDVSIYALNTLKAENINSKRNIYLSGGNICVNSMQSEGEATLVSGGGTIEADNVFSGGLLSLYTPSNITAFSLYSDNDISLSADGDITYNYIKAANDINLHGYSINHNFNAEAGNDINITGVTLNVNSTHTLEDEVLLAYGDINLDLYTLNNNGDISAFNDITVKSSDFNNNGLILANNSLNIEGGDINNNSGASLFGNNGLSVKTDGYITNNLGSIYANGNLVIQGLSGERSGDLNNIGGLIESRNGSIGISSSNINNLSVDNCDPATEVCYTDLHWEDVNELIWYTEGIGQPIYREKKQVLTNILEALSYGKIFANNNIYVDTGILTNHSSSIISENFINIIADSLLNIRSSFTLTLTDNLYAPDWFYMTLILGARHWQESYDAEFRSLTPAVISAPTVVVSATNEVYNDAYAEEDPSVVWQDTPISPKLQNAINTGIVNPVDTIDFSYSGLFKQASPDSAYLYVTTNRFLNKKDYVGADYFFDQTGIDYDKQSVKLIGDVFYEQKLVEDSIQRLTGSRSLEGYGADMKTQMTTLYDNAADAYADLGLKVGTALTEEQVAGLKDNIIWYVEQDIDGLNVYVPTLYLASGSKEKLSNYGAKSLIVGNNVLISSNNITNGGDIGADNLQMYAQGDIKNISGTIKADGNMQAEAANITNSGTLSAQNMALYADNNIHNIGGTIKTENNLDLYALGNIINESNNNSQTSNSGTIALLSFVSTSDFPIAQTSSLPQTAQISSGGQMWLNATGDITNDGGTIKADGNMQAEAANITNSGSLSAQNMALYADNNIHNIGGTIKTENNLDLYAFGNIINESNNNILQNTASGSKTKVKLSFSGSFSITETQTNPSLQTAQISSGGALNITTANNFENISADISSVGDMTIYADKDIAVKSHDLKTNNDIYHQSSNLNSFADIYLYSGGKLDILGSNVTAAKSLTLSGSEVNILSNIDEKYEGKRLKKTNVASNINGSEINVIADNDINVTSSNISSSAGNINFEAENVNVKSGINSNTYSVSSGSYKLEDSSTNNESSTIESSEDINMIAEDTFELTASDLYAANNINILAKDVNIQSGQDTTHYYRYNVKKRSFGRKKIEEDRKDTITNVSSDVVAGGNLNISSYNDILIKGSNLTTDNGSMLLQAGNDIDISAGINQEATLTRREKKGFLGLSGSKDVTYDNIKTLESSSVFSGDDITLTSGADTNLFASNVGAKGNGSIQTGGDFNLLAGTDSTYHYEEHLEKSFSNVIAGFDGGRAYAGVEYKINDSEKSSYDESAKASTISTGGNLSVTAKDDINITGSDISSSSGTFSANDINIQEMQEQHLSSSSEKEGTLSATVGLGNAYVDTGYAVKAFIEATKAVDDAKDNLSKIQELYAQGKATSSAVEDAQINLTAAAANLVYATAQVAQSAANSAAASGSAFTGLYSDVSLKYELTENNLKEEKNTSRSSNLYAENDISFTADNDILQKGSSVESEQGNVNYNAGNNLEFIASKDTFKSEQETKSYSTEIRAGTEGANVNTSVNSSQSRTLSDSYNNSSTKANNGAITYNAGGDMTGRGYNAYAQDITANVGGTMELESLQDTYYSTNSSFGVNGGYGGGVSFGANSGSGYTDMAWVNNQTSIIGGHSVDISAEDIKLKGSVIANIDESGKDGGNLHLSADSLEYSDIKDINNTSQQGFGFQVSSGKLADNSNPPQGSSSISFSDSSSEQEQITKATVGNGNIIIGNGDSSNIDNLNRDVSNSKELTKDKVTGALDSTVTIDNRVLSSAGRDAIANDLDNLGNNMLASAGGAIEGTGRALKVGYDVMETVASAVGGDIKLNQIADAVGNNITQSKVIADMHRACADGCTQMEYDNALKQIANYYGISIESVKTYVDNNDSSDGFHTRDADGKAGDIYINDNSSQNRETVEGHELSHAYQAENGLPYDQDNENLANLMGEQYASSYTYEDILDTLNIFQSDSIGLYNSASDSVYMQNNNYSAAQVPQDKRENWNDGPNSGQDLGADGFVKPNTQLYTPEGMSAQTQVAIIGGGLWVSILMPGAATTILGETGGTLFVGGAGLLGSGYGVYDGAGALGEWIGSENLSIVEKLGLSLRIGNAALGAVTGPFAGVGLFRTGNNLLNTTDSLPNTYQGIKKASTYLKSVGIPRDTRVEILQSFNPENMSVNMADNSTYGLRFYNSGDNPFGHYLFPTFTNQTTRTGLAIIPEFNNKMSGIQQFQIREGSLYIRGTVASQGIYPGGAQQIFTFPINLIKP